MRNSLTVSQRQLVKAIEDAGLHANVEIRTTWRSASERTLTSTKIKTYRPAETKRHTCSECDLGHTVTVRQEVLIEATWDGRKLDHIRMRPMVMSHPSLTGVINYLNSITKENEHAAA